MKVEKILTPAAFVAGILYKLLTFKVVTPPDMAALVTVSMDYSLTPAVIQVLLDQDLRFSTRRYRALKLTEFWVTLPLGSPFYLDFVLPGGQELKP